MIIKGIPLTKKEVEEYILAKYAEYLEKPVTFLRMSADKELLVPFRQFIAEIEPLYNAAGYVIVIETIENDDIYELLPLVYKKGNEAVCVGMIERTGTIIYSPRQKTYNLDQINVKVRELLKSRKQSLEKYKASNDFTNLVKIK